MLAYTIDNRFGKGGIIMDTSQLAQIQKRLERLEKQNRLFRYVIGSGTVIISFVLLTGFAGNTDHPDIGANEILTARALVLVDQQGRKRAELDMTGPEPRFCFYDKTGNTQIHISNKGGLQLFDATGEFGTTITRHGMVIDAQAGWTASLLGGRLGLSSGNGYAANLAADQGLSFVDKDQKEHLTLHSDDGLRFFDTEGNQRIHICPKDGLSFYSAKQKPLGGFNPNKGIELYNYDAPGQNKKMISINTMGQIILDDPWQQAQQTITSRGCEIIQGTQRLILNKDNLWMGNYDSTTALRLSRDGIEINDPTTGHNRLSLRKEWLILREAKGESVRLSGHGLRVNDPPSNNGFTITAGTDGLRFLRNNRCRAKLSYSEGLSFYGSNNCSSYFHPRGSIYVIEKGKTVLSLDKYNLHLSGKAEDK